MDDMDGRLSFDVYAQITDPAWQVHHEAFENRVSVVIGGPKIGGASCRERV